MDDRVIKAALDSFENDDFLHAKELVQGQIKQARNDFIKAKLGLKNDIEQQFAQLEPDPANNEPNEIVDPENVTEPEPEPKLKKRLLPKKKKL
jgi:hypothetical protein